MVQNYMESLVAEALKTELVDHAAKYQSVCTCPQCLARIQAVALNHLDPFYVTCIAGEVYGEYRSREAEHMSQVMVALGKGFDDVARHPLHPKRAVNL